jgi:two-component system phosphate regulon sensor histidine kinase PhoR
MVDEETVYEEIRPFVATIKQQHIDILENARMRQEFTANVSHELKTPLTAIYGYAEMITNGMADETDIKQFASYICENAKQLQSLIDDTIKLSQLDDESQKLEFETINLYEVAENAVEMVSISAAEMDVSMQLVGQKVYIAGNRTLIEELLYNLCSNAIRYNKRGGTVIVTVAYEAERPALIVADTGIGIPEDQQERVFERFYRVDQSHSRQTGGTGLGLAIVKQIVAQHEARITLESQVDVGTLVKVVF